MSLDFPPNEQNFVYDAPANWQDILRGIEIALLVFFVNDEKQVKELVNKLLTTAKEIERLSQEIASHETIKTKYKYDGSHFESADEIIRLENGQHFLNSFTAEVLDNMYVAGGTKKIINKINLECENDLRETIIQHGSVMMQGRFESPTGKNE